MTAPSGYARRAVWLAAMDVFVVDSGGDQVVVNGERAVQPGGPANLSYASPAFAPQRNEVWYSDARRGFIAVRLTNGVWPATGPSAAAPPAGPPATTATRPGGQGRSLPTTGVGASVGVAAALLLTMSLLVRRRST